MGQKSEIRSRSSMHIPCFYTYLAVPMHSAQSFGNKSFRKHFFRRGFATNSDFLFGTCNVTYVCVRSQSTQQISFQKQPITNHLTQKIPVARAGSKEGLAMGKLEVHRDAVLGWLTDFPLLQFRRNFGSIPRRFPLVVFFFESYCSWKKSQTTTWDVYKTLYFI